MDDGLRYKDRKTLCKYNLDIELFELLDLEIKDIVPLRNVFLIITNKGNKILKKVDYDKREIEFIDSALNYIKRSFNRVVDFYRSEDGNAYFEWNKDIYSVLNVEDARECEFVNPIDVKIAAKGIAELHKASEGFRGNIKEKIYTGKCVERFEVRLQEMIFFKKLAELHENKTDFDIIFLDNVDGYIEEIKNAIKCLKVSPYLKLCGEEDKIVLCHHDLAHHNILIENNEAYFIDFDYSIIDLRVHDLCNFITKAIKNLDFSIDRAKEILEEYSTVNKLSRREIEVLKEFIKFPEDFYSIAKDYYTRRKDWEEEVFLDRLKRKMFVKQEREEFIRKFNEY